MEAPPLHTLEPRGAEPWPAQLLALSQELQEQRQAEERTAIDLSRLCTTDRSLISESFSLIDSCAGAEIMQTAPITVLRGCRTAWDDSQSVNSGAARRANGGACNTLQTR